MQTFDEYLKGKGKQNAEQRLKAYTPEEAEKAKWASWDEAVKQKRSKIRWENIGGDSYDSYISDLSERMKNATDYESAFALLPDVKTAINRTNQMQGWLDDFGTDEQKKSINFADTLSQLKGYINDVDAIRKQYRYDVPDAEDYAQYSKATDEKKSSLFGIMGDYRYDYINDIDGTRTGRVFYNDFTKARDQSVALYARHMTEEEVGIYNYIYAKEGKDSADEYLSSIEQLLNAREAGEVSDVMGSNFLTQGMLAYASGVDSVGQGLQQLFSEEALPLSPTQIASQKVYEDIDSTVGKGAYEMVQSIGQMTPSIAVGTITGGVVNPLLGNAVGGLISSGAGALTQGLSIGGNSYQQAVLEGASPDDARAYATLVGASEAGLQYLLGGISNISSKLLGKGASKLASKLGANKLKAVLNGIKSAGLRTAIKGTGALAGNMASEGFEEFLQELIEPGIAALTLDKEYEVNWGDAAHAFIIGGLTGGLMEGASSYAGAANDSRFIGMENYLGKNKIDYFSGAGDLVSLTEKLGKLTKDTQNTADIDRQYAMRKAYYTGQEVAAQVKAGESGIDLTTAIISKMFPDLDPEAIYDALTDAKLENSTPEQAAKYRADLESRYFQESGKVGMNFEAAQALFEGGGARTTSASEAYRAWAIGQNEAKAAKKNAKKNAKAPSKGETAATVATAETAESQTFTELDDSEVKARAVAPETAQVEEGETAVVHDVNDVELVESGEARKAVRVASVENEKVTVELDNGERVEADKVSFSDLDTAMLYKRAGKMSANAANIMIAGYDRSGDANVVKYADAFDRAYTYGRYGISMNELKGSAAESLLTSDNLKAAYEAGRKDGLVNTAGNRSENGNRSESGKSKKKGKLHAEVDEKNLNDRQRTSLEALDRLARALGIDIYVFESKVDENGDRVGANGWYDLSDGSIHIDLHAGLSGEDTMLFTAAHELVHYIRDRSPEKFSVLADFLLERYGEQGVSVTSAINRQIAKAKRKKRKLSFDEAYEEVIADSMESMLADGKVIERIAELKAKDKTLFERMREYFRSLAQRVREAYKGLKPDSPEGRYVAEMMHATDRLQALFTEALVDASENGQKNNAEGGVRYSFKGYAEDGKGIYESNFPIGTPKKAKAERILRYIQDVWSKKPISLKIKDSSGERIIEARFDPTFDETKEKASDASKLMGGNRHGTSAEQRVTLDLADDYYQIASESTYNYSKDEIGKNADPHKGVKQWHYFINDIYFSEYGSEKLVPYRVSINVKERADGNYFYSFSAEKIEETSTQRTLHAAVSSSGEATTNGDLSTDSISQPDDSVKRKFSDRDYDSVLADPMTIEPVNEVTDQQKLAYLIKEFGANGYSGRPIVAFGAEGEESVALTGSHRIFAAREAGIEIPVVYVEYDHYNPLMRELADAYRDEERANIAQELYEEGSISKTVYDLIAREEELNYENYDVPYEEQFRYSDRDREALEEQMEVNRLLQAQNEVLREDNRRLIEAVNIRNTVANGTRFTEGSVGAAAGKLMQIANASGDRSKLVELLHGYYEFIARGQGVSPEALREHGTPIVDWLMEHRSGQREVDPETQALKGHLKSLRVSLSEVQMREVLALHDSYNEYRKGLSGTITLAKDAKTTLADVWGELSDLYPNYFDANTKEADMPDALTEAVEALRDHRSGDALLMQESELIEQGLHQQVYESFWDAMTLRTYGEAKDRQMAELRREHKRQMDNLRKRRDEQIANIRTKAEAYAEAVRQKEEKKARAAQEKYRQATKDWTAARERTELRRKSFKVYSELLTLLKDPTKQKHILPELQKAVAEALKVCDMDSVNAAERIERLRRQLATESKPGEREKINKTIKRLEAASEKVTERLGALEKAYQAVAQNDATQNDAEFIIGRIDVLKEVLGNIKFVNMDNSQLRQLYDFLLMVRQSVRNANRYFDEQRNTTISVESARAQNEEIAKNKKGATDEFGKPILRKLGWSNFKPIYAVKQVGNKVLDQLFGGLLKGESVYGVDMQESKHTFEKIANKYGYNKWKLDEIVHLTSSDGRSFALTKGQLMSIHALNRRGESALRHLTQGGLTFREAKTYTKTVDGKEVKYTVRHGDKFAMTQEQIVKAVADNLTAEQRGFVEEMQKYLSTELGAKGNEVSRVLYGIDIFGEANYFPMHTVDLGHEQKDVPVDITKLKEKGMTKKTDVNASNALYIDDFVETWAGHCNEMALYHSMVLPLENFTRVMNYHANGRSFKTELEANYGKECVEYFDDLIAQLNGGVRADSVEMAYGKFLSLFKKGATMLSMSVVVQQRSAIARAYGEILPQYFAGKKVPKKSFKDTLAEMEKYAGCTVIKSMGGFDVGVGGASTAWLTEKEYGKGIDSVKGFFTDSNYRDNLLSRMPAWVDERTWCHIWKAVKEEIADRRPDLKVDSEAYLSAVGERFSEVINKTQVYDSLLSRSANMRSKSGLMKMMTAFMAEPTTTLNMFTEGVKMLGDKKTRVKGLRYCSSVLVGVVYNAALASVIYAMRDDDDDETFIEKYLSSFSSETLDSLTVFGYVPFLKDGWSILQGWDVERSDMTLFSRAVNELNALSSAYKEGNAGKISLGWWNVGTAITDFFGLPLKNATRDVKAAFNFADVVGEDLGGDRDTSLGALKDQVQAGAVALTPLNKMLGLGESKTDQLYDAIVAGDENYLSRLKASYKSESALSSAIRKGLREKDERITQAAEAYISGDKRKYVDLLDEIEREGIFDREDIKAAAAAQISKLSPKKDEEPENEGEETSWYNASDINSAYESGDEDLAHEIMDDLIATKVANGKKEEEARSSVRSSMTRYWKKLYKAAYDSGDTEECERIEDILADSGLYGKPKELRNTLKSWRKDDEEEE